MAHWVDPDETDPQAWQGRGTGEPARGGTDCLSVIERARRTSLPYQHEADVHHTDAVAAQFQSRAYTDARVVYNSGLDVERRIKLLTRGVLWGGAETNQRFKAQYRRAGPPTESVPFGEYTVWSRFQYGTIKRGDSGVTFAPDDSEPEEEVRTLPWDELYDPVKYRLVELELVRNPSFARYRLQELGEWDAFETQLRYDIGAFAFEP
ncbi:hypothetical protein ACFQL1_02640 [Halomicroarcula sp. GCM10025709]|uniref:hypothetical protein n=1 Tax=Haloarcula TaxID=2237 RepID=UPI0024C3B753|nr:hypothetical protein [Halomicroarcula sp. YJ-61-S]